ncbi:hypothetical protein PENSPDRAFT_360888 [Peniophora sp. CONT]|nr:hypothetical protein PENSPDRAFT_360888 [Peniophora sp. CONT]
MTPERLNGPFHRAHCPLRYCARRHSTRALLYPAHVPPSSAHERLQRTRFPHPRSHEHRRACAERGAHPLTFLASPAQIVLRLYAIGSGRARRGAERATRGCIVGEGGVDSHPAVMISLAVAWGGGRRMGTRHGWLAKATRSDNPAGTSRLN